MVSARLGWYSRALGWYPRDWDGIPELWDGIPEISETYLLQLGNGLTVQSGSGVTPPKTDKVKRVVPAQHEPVKPT